MIEKNKMDLAREFADTFKKLYDNPITIPCGSVDRPHMVNPKSEPGITLCANCFQPVLIEDREDLL